MVGKLADVITYEKFQAEIFSRYDFVVTVGGGRISHFPIYFWMDLTTVQR